MLGAGDGVGGGLVFLDIERRGGLFWVGVQGLVWVRLFFSRLFSVTISVFDGCLQGSGTIFYWRSVFFSLCAQGVRHVIHTNPLAA